MTSEESPLPASATIDRRNEYSGGGKRFSFAVPTTKEENSMVKKRHVTDDNKHPWQCRLLEILNSQTVQYILIVLLLLDVCIIFSELALDAFYPNCNLIERDAISCCAVGEGGDPHVVGAVDGFVVETMRLLGAGGEKDEHHSDLCAAPLVETSHPAGCDDYKYEGAHIAHAVLFAFTLIILGLFEIELLLMVYLLGPKKYFSQVLYVLDLFVVTVSLALEITFRVVHQDILHDLVGILILFRVWRFVRIGHGLVASTFELQEIKMHELKHYVVEVEEMVTQCGGELPKERPSVLMADSKSEH
eukprot:scaffold8111_cov206-Skeletonema_marinoi.AAC.12